MSNPRHFSRPQGRGIQVRTTIRSVPSNNINHSSDSHTRTNVQSDRKTSTSSTSPSKPKSKPRHSKPSARYRKITAAGHGGDFVKDDDVARQFANRVVEIYAPSSASTAETRRNLPLHVQAKRDGESFQLPKLGTMCLNVIANSFDSHILPLRYTFEASKVGEGGVKDLTIKPSKGLFGIEVAGYNEEEDKDFVPDGDDEGESRQSKRPKLNHVKRIARKSETKDGLRKGLLTEQVKEYNAQLLELLPTRLTLALQERLERKAPQALSFEVLSKFFLSKDKVFDSKTFRVLAIVGGINEKYVVKLWQQLIYQMTNVPAHLSRSVMPRSPISTLRTLHLQAFTRLTTRELLNLFEHTQNLENVCLRGCVNVYPEAVAKLVENCGKTLRVVNFNWTSIGLSGVEHLIGGAPYLEILKVAHVRDLSDSSVTLMMNRIAAKADGSVPLGNLQKLKLNGTDIGIQGLGALLKHCGKHLKSLDIGNTRVGGTGCMDILLMLLGCDVKDAERVNIILEKVNLSHLQIPLKGLEYFLHAIARFKRLRKLNLDHIKPPSGGSSTGLCSGHLQVLFDSILIRAQERSEEGTDYHPDEEYTMDSVSVATTSMTTNNVHLDALCLSQFTSSPTQLQESKIIRSLNLSGMGFVGKDLMTYMGTESDEENSALFNTATFNVQHLNLAGCRLPSNCPWRLFGISGGIRTIDLSKTNVERDSVDKLIETNPFIEWMDLTGCRSIPVARRRNYLESDE